MKVSCVLKPNVIEFQNREKARVIEEDDVLVKIKCVGICGSDIHIFHGTNPFAKYPRVWGHEFTGEVVETGSQVKKLKVGDHIVAEPFLNCGECYACKNGRGNVCENLQVYGVHVDGGCQEYITLKAKKAHRIKKSIPWETAVLAEPLTIGFQAVERGRVQKGDLVLIMGAGTVGLCCLMAAKYKEAKVVITDLFDKKLEYAKSLNADYTINVNTKNLEDEINKITNGKGPNVILDAVCTKESLETAIEYVSQAGRVVELGYADIASEVPHVTLMKKEVDLMGSRLQSDRFEEAIDFIEKNQELIKDFITKKFSSKEIEEAFRYVSENNEDIRKVLISMDLELME